MYKIVSTETGKPISRITIRSGVGLLGRVLGDVSPAYDFETDEKEPLFFENIELCYALLAFLSLSGFEVLKVDILYTEDWED